MSQIITLGNTVLPQGKKGILKPMADGSGYTRMGAGGFNIPNRVGITYGFNQYLKECIPEDSELNRRVENGHVYCELGHPPQYYLERINGQVVRTQITELWEWINRLKTIVPENVCAHIRKIHWIMTGGDNDPIYNEVELCPFGTANMRAWVEDGLSRPDINFAISIRTVTAPQKMGDRVRYVEHFTGYDVVPEQGMANAAKHAAAGLEDFSNQFLAPPGEITTTLEEMIHVCEVGMRNPVYMARVEGTESMNQMVQLVDRLKKIRSKNSVQLVRSNSLGAFV